MVLQYIRKHGQIRRREVAELCHFGALVKAAYGKEPPLVIAPFAGGFSIPLEALRPGCDAFASDLNPVACLILKAMLGDIPRNTHHRNTGSTEKSKKLCVLCASLAQSCRHEGRGRKPSRNVMTFHCRDKAMELNKTTEQIL